MTIMHEKRPTCITAEILVEANAAAGRPPITLEEAEQALQEAVELGYLIPADEDEEDTLNSPAPAQ